MTSEIRANTLKNRVGLGTISFTNTGSVVSGIVTANTFRLPDATSGSLGRLQFGNGLDLSLFHDGTNSFLVNNTGYLSIQSQDGVNGIFIARNAEVNLYYGSSVRMQTSSAGITINRDLDVDGHTNLDNVSVAGVTTMSGNLTISNTDPQLAIHDTNHNPSHYYLKGVGGAFKITDSTNGDRIIFSANGSTSIVAPTFVMTGGAQVSSNLGVTGNLILTDNIIHDGDTNTKIRFPANDTISFETAGSEGLRIDNNGRLVIGGTSAGTYHGDGDNLNLYSSGNTGLTVFSGTSSLGSLFFADDNNDVHGQRRGAVQYNHNGNSLAFWTNASEKVRITSDGDVSISSSGTVYGVSKLTILPADRTTAFDAGDGDTWHDVVLKQTGSATNNAVGIAFQLHNNVGYHKNAGTGIAAVKNGTNGDYGSDLVFITRPQSAVAEERLRITSGGLVKIDEASPVAGTNGQNALLQVKSTSQYDGLLLGHGYGYGTIGTNNAGALIYTGNASPGNLGGTETIIHDWWSGSAGGGGPNRRMMLTTSGNLSIGGRDEALSNYSASGAATTKLAVVDNGSGSGYHEVAHFTAGTDSNDTGAIVRITQFNNDRGLFIKAGRGTSDQAKALIGMRNSSATDSNWITLTQNADQITCHKNVDIINGLNLSLGGTSGTHAPLHVKSENTGYGKNAVFGANGWVNNANYHYSDATISLLGRDLDSNDKGVGIEFTARNIGNTNWLHGALTMARDGAFRLYAGGAGTTNAPERFILDVNGNSKLGSSTPTAFTGSAPNHTQRFLGKKCMQGSVTSTATTAGNGTGTFDLGRLWLVDDSVTEIFLQIMRNDNALYNSHYCKAFIQKVRGSGMTQGHILYQNGAHAGFSVSGIQAGGYTASGGSSHGTQISVTGAHGGVIYRMTCFYTTISKNDMY